MKKSWVFSGIALAVMAGICCEAAEGVINASWLNARVFPELKAPVAVKLPRGKKVEITTVHNSWLEIVAPDTTPVFAAAAYLDGNKALRDMNLRIKPAPNAPVIGRIKKGDMLKAVSVPNRFGWVQVAPLADMKLYVYKAYVTYDAAKVPTAKSVADKERAKQAAAAPAPVKKVEKKAAPAAAPAPVKKVEKKAAPAPVKKVEQKAAPAPVKKVEQKAAPAPVKKVEKKAAPAPVKKVEKKAAPAPAKKAEKPFVLTAARKKQLVSLRADIKNGQKFEKNGRLVAVAKPIDNCTAFAVTNLVDGQSMGFVFSESVDLKKMVNKEVSVKGIAYKVEGWRNPVVAIRTISVIGE